MATPEPKLERYKTPIKPKGTTVRIHGDVYAAIRFYAARYNTSMADAASQLIREGIKTIYDPRKHD